MKRRNFLSGLLAAPLALKARLARFIGREPVELCSAPIGNVVLRMQPDVRSPEGRAFLDVLAASPPFSSQGIKVDGNAFIIGLDQSISDLPSAHCSLQLGHKGPHALLNPR